MKAQAVGLASLIDLVYQNLRCYRRAASGVYAWDIEDKYSESVFFHHFAAMYTKNPNKQHGRKDVPDVIKPGGLD